MIKVLKGFHKKQSSENLQVSLRSRRGYFFLKKEKRKIFDVFDGYKNYDLQGTSRERSKL